jgi:hypothetical protein
MKAFVENKKHITDEEGNNMLEALLIDKIMTGMGSM